MCAGCSFRSEGHDDGLGKPQYARNSENSRNGLEGAVVYNPRPYSRNIPN